MRDVFSGMIDYAGLFPPATSTMVEAVRGYRDYRASSDRALLGRFVVPAGRLSELGAALEGEGIAVLPDSPWRLSAVMGAAIAEELARIEAFNAAWGARGAIVDCIECKASTPQQAATLGEQIPPSYRRHFEVPIAGPYHELVVAMRETGVFAKVRTGGTVPELFPAAGQLAGFLAAATQHRLPFKATAGLHHPVRGRYPLTYAPDAPRDMMYGFLNVLLATAQLRRGGTADAAEQLLQDADPSSFVLDREGISWRGERFDGAELKAVRATSFLSFGSCSFREPVDELHLGDMT